MKTLVLGATDNPERYAWLAVERLLLHGHEVVPVGVRKGTVHGLPILNSWPANEDIDTITLYIGPARQPVYYDAIIKMKPRRIIFNPGAENEELEQLASSNGIIPLEACTLVLLSTGQY